MQNQYPVKRNLDGIYHRIERDGKWENVCLTDMTREEIWDTLTKHSNGNEPLWMRRCVEYLIRVLREIGDAEDIVRYSDDE